MFPVRNTHIKKKEKKRVPRLAVGRAVLTMLHVFYPQEMYTTSFLFSRNNFHARKIRRTWLFLFSRKIRNMWLLFYFLQKELSHQKDQKYLTFSPLLLKAFMSERSEYTAFFFLPQKDQKYMFFFFSPFRKSFHARKIRSPWPSFFFLQKELSRQKDQKKRLQQQIKTKRER